MMNIYQLSVAHSEMGHLYAPTTRLQTLTIWRPRAARSVLQAPAHGCCWPLVWGNFSLYSSVE